MMNKSDSVWPLILLGAVTTFSLVNNLVWLLIDTRPPRWDEAHYLTMSLKYHDSFLSGGIMSLVRSLLAVDPLRPPLVPALAVPLYIMLERSADSALGVNLLAFVFLILAVYGLGARLASPWSGLLAAFLVSTYPGIFGLSRLFLLEFVDAALVAAFLYLLVRTEVFSRTGPSIALGAVIGFGLLCRTFFPVFVVGPLGISLYAAWREWRVSRRMHTGTTPRVWVNGALALLVACGLAAPWYVTNMVPVITRSLSAAYGAEAVGYGPSNPLTLHAIVNYFIIFANLHTTPFGMVMFLLAAVILWMKWSSLPSKVHVDRIKGSLYLFLLLFSAFVVPLVFFTSLPSQDPKNILPVLPAIAVITACGLLSLRSLPMKKILIGSCIVWSLFQFWIGTYGLRELPNNEVRFQLGSPHLVPLIIYQAPMIPGVWLSLPRRDNWKIPEVLSRITEVSTGLNGSRVMVPQAVVAVVPDHPFFNMNNYAYYSVLGRLPLQVEHPGDPRDPAGGHYKAQLRGVDFAVVKTGDVGPALLNPHNEGMVQFLRSPASGFVEIPPRFPLPDGSEAVLYAALGHPLGDDAQHTLGGL
ncbi:MAG: glycosyltransferase family 39 protein [Candidatus Methylomirabilis oxyfera]|nr:glycosyltransferase family 39 protein [Candidatus Methylomirabilis oxyfera]